MKPQQEVTETTIASRIADQIREEILSRQIDPGTRITVREISEKYGVSSMPVREAFHTLCGENLLVANPYKGATVLPVTSTLVAELNDLQCALEGLLVELCMRKGYPEEILLKLEEINEQMAALQDDEECWREKRLGLNIEFHTTEYSLCKEHMAYQLFHKNLYQLAAIRKYHKINLSRAKQTLHEHQQIIAALRDNDVVTAIGLTRQHTLNSKAYALRESFDI